MLDISLEEGLYLWADEYTTESNVPSYGYAMPFGSIADKSHAYVTAELCLLAYLEMFFGKSGKWLIDTDMVVSFRDQFIMTADHPDDVIPFDEIKIFINMEMEKRGWFAQYQV